MNIPGNGLPALPGYYQALYQSLAKTNLVGIGVYDAAGRILFFNEKSISNLGLAGKKVAGKTLPELIGEPGEPYHERILSFLANPQESEFEDHIVIEGNSRWFHSYYSTVRITRNGPAGVQVLSVDITPYKDSEQMMRREAFLNHELLLFQEQFPSMDNRQLFSHVLGLAMKLTGSGFGFLYVRSGTGRAMALAAHHTEELPGAGFVCSPGTSAAWKKSLRTGDPVLVNDCEADPASRELFERSPAVARFCILPFPGAARIAFSIVVGNKDTFYDETDLIHMKMLSAEVLKILDQRRAEDRMTLSEELYHTVFRTAMVGIAVYDRSGRIRTCNDKAAADIGFRAGEVIGKTMPELLGKTGENHHRRIVSIARGGPHMEFTDRVLIAGSPRWFQSQYQPVLAPSGRITGVQVISQDVTRRMAAEEKIVTANEKLARAQRIARLGIWERHLATGEIVWSDEMYRLFGVPSHVKPTFELVMKLFPPGELERLEAAISKATIGEEISTEDFRIIAGDGSERFVHIEGYSTRDQDGKPQVFYGTVQDITERKKIEKKLLQLSRAVEQSPSSIEITDTAGNIVYVNPKFCRTSGYTSRELLGQNPRILKSGHTPEAEYRKLWETITSGKVWRGEFMNRKKNGSYYYESAIISPILDEEKKITHFIAAKEDITELKKAYEKIRSYADQLRSFSHHHDQLMEKERLHLAREIHDALGASLSGIMLHLKALRNGISEKKRDDAGISGQIDHLMEMAGETVGTMRRLVQGLRPGILDELGLIEAVRWYATDLQAGTGIRTEIKVSPENIVVGQEQSIILFRIIQELLTNVVKHARATRVSVILREKNRRLMITVKDNGIGISLEDTERKRSYGIMGIRERVTILNGKVEFKGTPSHGTTIRVSVPIKINT